MAITALASSYLPISINEFGLSGIYLRRMLTVVIKIETKLTPKRTLHLMCSSSSDLIKTMPKLKANITPIITNNVAKIPNTPLWVSYLGANSPI